MKKRKRNRIRKYIIRTAVFSSVLTAVVTSGLFLYSAHRYQKNRDEISEYFEVKELIEKNYIENPDEESYMDNALKGLVAGIGDEYAAYMTPEEYRSNMESLQGSFAGIGVTVTKNENNEFQIVEIKKNSPASEKDIRTDDIIIKVNDIPTENMDLNQLVSLVKGEEGTEVTVILKRNDKEFDITLTRKQIEDETVEYTLLEDDIAYIKITSFKEVTTEQFEVAFNTAIDEGAKKMIYDLRNNGGGLLTACEAMLDPFLPACNIAYADYKSGKSEVIANSGSNEITVPTVILVNEDTASASELFSSAMRDFEKAKLVGTKTYGKGIMQNTIPVSNGGALKITVAKYRTAKSDCFHGVGLTPDYIVELPEGTDISIPDPEKDPQLKKAMEILK